MARPWQVRYAGAKHHVTVRGNGRQAMFLAEEDRTRFLEQLASALERDDVILYAFVLMPNHYHLLIESPPGNWVNHRWLALMEQGGMGANRRAYGKYIAQLAGTSQREVGRHFGYAGNGAVGKQRAKLRELMKADPRLAEHVARSRNRLKNA